MKIIRITGIRLELDGGADDLKRQAAKRLKVPESAVVSLKLFRKAVDARKKDDVHFVCTVECECTAKIRPRDSRIRTVEPYHYQLPACKTAGKTRPVVVGFGPAGLFAALVLAQAGQRPVVLERGPCVGERSRRVRAFWKTGKLDPEGNVQFGEGGAGTFSDGKLNTGTKDPRSRKVLEEFAAAGAPEEILWQAKPHIGTDLLPQTIRNLREKILSLGGEVRFETKLERLILRDGAVAGVGFRGPDGEGETAAENVILAVGHSARDTFESLFSHGIPMQAKPFSVGARIEHPQSLIDRAQYGKFAGNPALGAADYRLAVHLPDGRGVYTFCMCPGGEVVAAASEPGRLVTNGMSRFARGGKNANSALLVGVGPKDFGTDSPLAGMEFQRRLEERAFRLGGGNWRAPVQRVEDFLNRRPTKALGSVEPTYPCGVTPASLDECLPGFAADSMREGIRQMDRRLSGFAFPDAVLTSVETRSSSPVRLPRGEDFQSVGAKGLYPCGEGAGYAGGIVSAAVDGIRCAEAILEKE